MTARAWTNHEVQRLRTLLLQGAGDKFIAAQLGRSLRSIQYRCTCTDVRRRGQRVKIIRSTPSVVITAPDQVLLIKAEVVSYYELGWRFVGFEGALCVFEWGGKGDARYPEISPDRDAVNTPVSQYEAVA